MLDALEKEISALVMANPDIPLDREHELLPHLVKTMVGKERQVANDDGTPMLNPDTGAPMRAKITEQDIVRLRDALNEMICSSMTDRTGEGIDFFVPSCLA